MHTLTLKALSDGLAEKKFSSVELAEHFLKRIQGLDPQLNSFITTLSDTALAQAKAADAARANGDIRPLLGIPMAHKDIFCLDGTKTSCGSKMLDNFTAPYTATMVQQVMDAGMVTLGKTNMDEFAMGSSNETSFYGPTRNPWDLNAVPGGSSGGSAAAVAARLVPFATGTDTGGSIRQPAALCGITGLKPTYGRVSRYGMVAFASSLDQAGPFTQTAEDAAMVLSAMAGFDPKDSTSSDQVVDDYVSGLGKSIKGMRIGLPQEYFQDLSSEMQATLQSVIDTLTQQGAIIEEISLPHVSASIPVYYIVAPAECSSNLSRFDGVRYGYRCDDAKDLMDLYVRSRTEAFGEEVKRRIMTGAYVLSAGYYDAYYLKAQQVRQLIHQDFEKAFEKVDCILGPTTPTPAFNIGEKVDDPVAMYLSDIYTIAVNLAGLPGMSIPAGFHNGRPVGAQLIGKAFGEATLLNVAHQYQQQTDWHTQVPTFAEEA